MVDMVIDIILSFLMGFTSGILIAHIVIFVESDDEEKEDEGE